MAIDLKIPFLMRRSTTGMNPWQSFCKIACNVISKLYNLRLNWYNVGTTWRNSAFLFTIKSVEKNPHEEGVA